MRALQLDVGVEDIVHVLLMWDRRSESLATKKNAMLPQLMHCLLKMRDRLDVLLDPKLQRTAIKFGSGMLYLSVMEQMLEKLHSDLLDMIVI
jgi:hypothetical protein